MGWHWLIKLYKFQVYSAITHYLYTAIFLSHSSVRAKKLSKMTSELNWCVPWRYGHGEQQETSQPQATEGQVPLDYCSWVSFKMEGKKETNKKKGIHFYFPLSPFFFVFNRPSSRVHRMGWFVGKILKENRKYTMNKKVWSTY